jgi:hypothetical protein
MSKFVKLLSVAALAGFALTFSNPAHADQWRHGDGSQRWGYHQWPGYQHGYPRSFAWPGNRFYYHQNPHYYGFRGQPYGGWYPHRSYGYPQFHRDPWSYRNGRRENWRYGW